MNKPCSPSAERNKDPILDVLKRELSAKNTVLEIGSGTGQHACYFANALTDIIWQPTELSENIPTIDLWLSEHSLANVLDPIELDVDVHPWPDASADVCFTCNTFHIVSQASVCSIFQGCQSVLAGSGKLCVYGPFTIEGKHIGAGNEEFDQWLRESDPNSGVRDITQLDEIARQFGFTACRRIEMPANNFMLVWELATPKT